MTAKPNAKTGHGVITCPKPNYMVRLVKELQLGQQQGV
jgi:hypothetical protein